MTIRVKCRIQNGILAVAKLREEGGNLKKKHQIFLFKLRLVWAYPDPARRWRCGASIPGIHQTTGPILDPKTLFDSLENELFAYTVKF